MLQCSLFGSGRFTGFRMCHLHQPLELTKSMSFHRRPAGSPLGLCHAQPVRAQTRVQVPLLAARAHGNLGKTPTPWPWLGRLVKFPPVLGEVFWKVSLCYMLIHHPMCCFCLLFLHSVEQSSRKGDLSKSSLLGRSLMRCTLTR